MKTIRLFPLLAAAALMAAGCEKPENTNEEGGEETVAVESITLDSSISEGVSLVEGETLSIADLVTVLPENATDRTVSYSSSDEAVATVSEAGVITAVAEGAATISVSAGEKTVKFIITVSAAVQTVDITSITFSADEQEYELAASTEGIDLNSLLTVEPAGYTEGINFASSDPAVASVDENGKMTLHKLSEGVKITASAAGHSDIKDEITIKVYSIPGDYPRFEGDEDGEEAAIEGENWYWTMTFSDPLLTAAEQRLINGRNNSLTAMLDGRKIVSRSGATDDAELSNGTAFCVKNSRNISLRPGDRVFVSCPAGQTALQAIRAVVFPFLAAAAGYILAPAGKTGGGKAAGALAAFFAAACLAAGIRVLLRKKNLLSGGEPEITGRTDSPEPPAPGDIP